MLRTGLLSLMLFVSLSSTSLLRKSISRRQSEPELCYAIEGFDCKCTYYRVTCTSERDLPQAISVLPNEKQKYQSVELVINGEREQTVYDYTFEPAKQLFKSDADHLEFRIKFEKFTALHLSSPGIFNRVFPDNLPSNVRKVMALEIYNPLVQPDDNVNLFANVNVDSLELYVLYPFRGTFQQIFTGANVKYLRLSGGDMRSDFSQPFTGNIGRLELVKQASQLSVQNFPAYPAHEFIIHAFYVTDFNSENPPNYSNLGELRIHSQERIPANAFQQFPNLHTLSISTEKDIDPRAFDGLYKLEKLTIKDTKPSLDLLNNLASVKEFETNVEKLGERDQCDLIEKLASGYIAVQAIPNGYECTCVSAYLDTASGRYPCDAQNCEQSACPSIRNNYDESTRTFKTPPPIKRADGTDALRPREPKVYTTSYHVPQSDQEKVQKALPHHSQQSAGQQSEGQQQADDRGQADAWEDTEAAGTDTNTNVPSSDQHQHGNEQGQWSSDGNGEQSQQPSHSHSSGSHGSNEGTHEGGDAGGQADSEGGVNQQEGDGQEKSQSGDGTNAQQEGKDHENAAQSGELSVDEASNSTDTSSSSKKKFTWLPIIIVVAVIAAIIIIGIILFVVLRKKPSGGYNAAATSEQAASSGSKA